MTSEVRGDFTADLSQMPVANAVVYGVIILAVLALAGMFAMWLIKKSGVSSLGGFKIKREQQGLTTMHNMDEDVKDLDDALKQRLRQFTNSMSNRILDMFSALKLCAMTRRSLAAALRYPLYESVNNNHFTKELMNDHFDNYRQRVLDQLQDEYSGIYLTSKDITCTKDSILPPWQEAKIVIEQLLDTWLRNTCVAQQDCSNSKIDMYKKYRDTFNENEDEFRSKITVECIEKNERYVTELGRRVIALEDALHSRKDAVDSFAKSYS